MLQTFEDVRLQHENVCKTPWYNITLVSGTTEEALPPVLEEAEDICTLAPRAPVGRQRRPKRPSISNTLATQ
jgi:hypothetical protein